MNQFALISYHIIICTLIFFLVHFVGICIKCAASSEGGCIDD